jgi:hypothetical protein
LAGTAWAGENRRIFSPFFIAVLVDSCPDLFFPFYCILFEGTPHLLAWLKIPTVPPHVTPWFGVVIYLTLPYASIPRETSRNFLLFMMHVRLAV